MQIRPIQSSHFEAISDIYLQGILTKMATFQTTTGTWEEWDSSHLVHSRLGTFVDNQLIAWAALSQVSSRCVYGGVAEVSIYIHESYRGQGVGKALLKALINDSELHGIWTLQSGIFPENKGSIVLHEHCGFRKIGFREKIGQLDGIWRDNIIMERRSRIVGKFS